MKIRDQARVKMELPDHQVWIVSVSSWKVWRRRAPPQQLQPILQPKEKFTIFAFQIFVFRVAQQDVNILLFCRRTKVFTYNYEKKLV